MLDRLKRLWKLSKKDPIALDKLIGISLDSLTDEQIEKLPDAGDGKAEFLGEGTEEEYLEMKRKDDGTDKWYKRIGL